MTPGYLVTQITSSASAPLNLQVLGACVRPTLLSAQSGAKHMTAITVVMD